MNGRRWGVFFPAFLAALLLAGAEYKGRNIDGTHFSARVHVEGDEAAYEVDVVFVGRAANVAFPDLVNPAFRATLINGKYLTLYLLDEVVADPANLRLKQVSPPLELDPREEKPDPADWPATRIWVMNVDVR